MPVASASDLSAAQLVGLVLVTLLSALCWTYSRRAVFSSSSANPSIATPRPKFLRGNAAELDTKGAASCKAWYSLYERYGPAYEMTIPFFRLHIINHPRYLEHIQKVNAKNYIRGAFTRNVFGQLHRGGIFVSDGTQWTTQRKAATKAFSKRNFETHITSSVHHWLGILMKLLDRLSERHQAFDFQELMGRLMFCLFLRVAFHEDKMANETLSEDPACLETMPEYVRALDQAQLCEWMALIVADFSVFDRRRRDPLWRITEWVSGESKVAGRAVNLFYKQIDDLIARRLKTRKQHSEIEEESGVDLLELFLQSTRDPNQLAGMIVSFLIAGRDTTAFSTTWMMKEIHHNSNDSLDLKNRILAELHEHSFTDFLSHSDVGKLRFVNAVWDENARLNSVSPAGQMEAAEDDILPAVPELNIPPRKVKKGDVVSYHNYVMARMPEIWGENCRTFDPGRWMTDDGQSITYSPFKYHSWNAGPRSCLGRSLATYEGISITCAILQRFQVQLEDREKAYEPLAAMNMGIKGGLWMTVKRKGGS